MKFIRSIVYVALASLALATLMSGIPVVEHATAAIGLGGASLAMAGLVTIKAPVTVFHKGQYVAPGTEIELPKAEADRLTAAHGAFGGPGDPDPANTQMRNVDIASINSLNEQSGINKGTGIAEGNEDFDAMRKDELVSLAGSRGLVVDPTDTKAEIIAKLKG